MGIKWKSLKFSTKKVYTIIWPFWTIKQQIAFEKSKNRFLMVFFCIFLKKSSYQGIRDMNIKFKVSSHLFVWQFSCWDVCFKNNKSFEMKVEYKRKNTFVRKGPLSLSVVLQQKGQYKDHGSCSKKDNTRNFEKITLSSLKGDFFVNTITKSWPFSSELKQLRTEMFIKTL